jgi:hypothetical protein
VTIHEEEVIDSSDEVSVADFDVRIRAVGSVASLTVGPNTTVKKRRLSLSIDSTINNSSQIAILTPMKKILSTSC